MDSQSLFALIGLALILAAVIFYVLFWPAIRRRRILARAFPESWLRILQQRLPFFGRLSTHEQQRFKELIRLFLADKQFIGCAGQEINDDIRVTIAAQACLLVLNRPESHYQNLRSILVYPSTFVAKREVRDELGLVSTSHSAMLGESWSQGKVVLAWDNVEHGVRDLHDGQNVVLHEFAHQLDSESGATNGAPLLLTRGGYKSWATVFQMEFEQLQQSVLLHQPSLIDEYGATNPAEFFAVATETFFERPREMAAHHSELYRELSGFFKIDPARWAQ
ncbi:MAG: zinc-dependent peptidase [Pseudomonadales bacterium]|nr:zinc-dependent peptidase [Pseudomonadales bacterium]